MARYSIVIILCWFHWTTKFAYPLACPSNGWTKWTSCPNPTAPLASAVATFKNELNASGCLVPKEFYGFSVESAMMMARNSLAEYKKKNNITTSKIRPPVPIHPINVQDASGKRSKRDITVIESVSVKRSKRQVINTNATTVAPSVNATTVAATTAKMNTSNTTGPIATSPPSNTTALPPIANGTATTPALNGTTPTRSNVTLIATNNGTTPPPPPATKPPPPIQEVLRHRVLSLNDMCKQKMQMMGSNMDPAFQKMADRIQNTLLYMYDPTVPNPAPKNLVELFHAVNPNLAPAIQKLSAMTPAQLATIKTTAAHLKTSMTSLLELYFNATVTLLSNQSFPDAMLANVSNQFMKYSNDAANDWYQIMSSAGYTLMNMPGLSTPYISGNMPSSTILWRTEDPCYILLAMCTLVDNGQLDYALSFSTSEMEGLPFDKASGLKTQDFSNTPFPEQAIAGCGYCFRKIQCCSGKYSNFLEQEIQSDICEDHSSACEVPPMADNTCDYVKTVPNPNYDSMLANNVSANNVKTVQYLVDQLKDRMSNLVDSSSPVMNCTKIDKLCYCCCGGFEPVMDPEGYVTCRVYQKPAVVMTTKPAVMNVTAAPTTAKPANGSSNTTSSSGATNGNQTVLPVNTATTAKPANTSSNPSNVAANNVVNSATVATVATTKEGTTVASIKKSLSEDGPLKPSSIEHSPGGCFGSFKYPAECVDNNDCLYQLSWKTVSSPKGLQFDISAKASGANSWTGVLLGLNSRLPQSFLAAYLEDDHWKTIDGYLDKNHGFEIRDRNVDLADSTVSLQGSTLKLKFTKTCESFVQKYNQDFCSSSIFYFAPVKSGLKENLNSFDFAKQTVPVGPLSMDGCF